MGYARHRIILDRTGVPCDYEFLEVNTAFELLSGLKSNDLIGSTAQQCGWRIANSDMETIGSIALNGGENEFDHYCKILDKWYQVNLYSTSDQTFTALFTDITAYKIREKALQSTELRYLGLIRNLNAGVVVHNAYTSIIMNNGRASTLLGLSEDQMRGKQAIDPAWMFVNKSGDPLALDEYPVNKVKATGQIIVDQVIGINRPTTDDLIWVMINGFPIFDVGNENISEIVISFIDITEQKNAEDLLLESESTFRKLFEDSADAILLINGAGIFYECNQAALDLLKMSREELLLASPAAISPEFQPTGQRSDELACDIIATAYKNGHHRFDWTHINTEGTEFIVEVSLMPITIKGETFLHTTWRDITERKRVETALSLTRLSVEMASDALFWITPDAHIVDVNEAACRTLGYGREELLRLSVPDVDVHYNDQLWPHHFAELRQLGSVTLESQQRTKEGVIFPVEVVANYVKHGTQEFNCAFVRDISDRKRIEKALSESEELYRLINNSTVDQIYSYDCNNRFTSANRQLCENLHRTPEEIIGKTYWELGFPADLCEEWDEMHRQVYANGSLVKNVCTPMPDGTDLYLEINLSVMKDDKGAVIGIAGINRNITDRTLMEKALRESEYFFKETQRAARIGSFQSEFYPNDIWKTSTVCDEIFGMDENYNKTVQGWLDLLHPADSKAMIDYVTNDVIGKGIPFDKEYRIVRHTDGATRWVWGRGQTIIDSTGRTTGLIGTIQDVTDRKEAEAAMKELNTALAQSLDGIAFVQMDGYIKFVNSAFAEMHGFTQEELIGQHFQLCHTPEQLAQEILPTIDLLINHGTFRDAEIGHRRKDGTVFPTYMTSTLVKDDSGTPTGMLSVTRDISAKKTAEAEKAKLTEQLHQSQKMEAVGQLAGGVAHDFNNALGGIMGAIELLKSGALSTEESQEYFDMILTAADRAADLTKKLLTFSRKGAKVSSAVDCFRLVNESAELLKHTINKNIAIHVENRATHTSVIGDDSLIHNALMNMGINASHAMPDGGALTFTLENSELDAEYCEVSPFDITPGEYLEITIRDTGTGMSPDVQSRIFEPFYTTKEAGKGTGLGMAAVYGTVQEHGGSILVYSELGRGTVFHIYLPVFSHTPPQAIESRPIVSDSGTILIIDDEELIRSTASAMLRSMGYRVILATNGLEGVETFTETKDEIDLIILDMIMPIMGGREAFAKLREIDPTIPIVLSSGFSKEGDLEAMSAQGISGFLQKPFRRDELAEMVHNNALISKENTI